jgi:mannose/fructose/N-acetylgalactosamine-specific phosphotransferase system component IIC
LEQLWPDAAGWLLKAAALGALFAVDGQAVLHLVAAQPLVVGVVTGWALGDARLGLIVGAYAQLISKYGPPRGRVAVPDTASGTIAAVLVAAAFAARAPEGEGHLALAMGAAVGVAWLGGLSERLRRRLNAGIAEAALRRVRGGERGVLARAHAVGVGIAAVRGGLTAAVGSAAGLAAGSVLINLFAGLDFGAAFALIPALGLGSFFLGVVRANAVKLAGFAAGLAAALLMGLKFGIT